MSSVPLKPLRSTHQDDAPCPAYAEDASPSVSAAAESQPFISLSERDIEAATVPPPAYAYTQNQDDDDLEGDTDKDDPFKRQSVPVKIIWVMLSVLMFAVGFGGVLTLFIVFFRILVLVWRKLGLL
ncbi:uncharacterized protein F4807DRAFT_87646 [Annulohypoxylon truncatum]|uniref:uncharacterized protein n=1 Tax=Annulohypoxylon truncatum TaxID=327061 RepID=UPI0020073B5A|nr:uncharacterized protein F4807DRAFT_87646 [Annulohypoxylon truncatum]KAI1209717.1 hypothetical protein F4807DRAFT_87646 [Annulohypoxylon truncatum]